MARKVTSVASAQDNGVQGNHRSTEPKKNYSQGVNTFNNSYYQAFSQRYADIHPFFVIDAIERDDIPFRSTHELGTYTLQSPMKSDLHMHKTIAMIPFKAILPNTWSLFYVNPTKGDDVPDDVYCNLNLLKYAQTYVENLVNSIQGKSPLEQLKDIVSAFITLESFLSSGSLLSALKMNFSSFTISMGEERSMAFDNVFDIIMSCIFDATGISVVREYGTTVDKITNKLSFNEMSPIYRLVSNHLILDVMRERDYSSFSTGIIDGEFVDPSSVRYNLMGEELDWANFLFYALATLATIGEMISINQYEVSLERPIAYQLAVTKFMTDDSIDNIYSANIFRNNFTALFSYGDMFEWNGQPIIYDIFSKHNLEKAFSQNFELACSLLFSFRKSLKYGDYFVSARPSPYALGDVNAPVVNNFVSAIDITRKISEQRFLNWNNRTGMSYDDYVEGLTGVRPTLDITEPLFVSHEVFRIGGMEVENTGAAQQDAGTNSVTTLLKSNQSNFMYDIGITDPCIIIGLSHFDCQRLYTRVMDRSVLKSNRFDFFNKFYQYTGDQEIKRIELNAKNPTTANFAYTTRYMQYKQQVSHAGGAFLGPLRSWAMVADADDDVQSMTIINSDFIRNTNSAFDIFYKSLTGLSLGNYFHFAVVYYNDLSNMRRAMDIAPDIL